MKNQAICAAVKADAARFDPDLVPLKKPALIRFREEGGGGARLCSITHIGERGMRAFTDAFPQRGRTYVFELILPFLRSTAIVKAEVRRAATNVESPLLGRYRCDLVFESVLPGRHMRDLSDYIALQTGTGREAASSDFPSAEMKSLPVVVAVDRDGALTRRLEAVLRGAARVVRCVDPQSIASLVMTLDSPLVVMESGLEDSGPTELGPELKSRRETRPITIAAIADGYTESDVIDLKNHGVDRFLLTYMSDGHLEKRLQECLATKTGGEK